MFQILDTIKECSSPALSSILKAAQNVLTLIQIIGPIVLIVALIINIIKLMSKPDDKKLKNSIRNSMLATVILFVMPVFINVTMRALGESFTLTACWNAVGNYSSEVDYIESEDDRKNVIPDPSKYGTGATGNNSNGGGTIDGTAKKIGDVVWNPNDVTQISNLTSSQLIAALNASGGNAKNFIPYASGLITAEHKHNVNVFFLVGVEALESGWITSPISRNCNNLGGVCASSAHPSNGCGSNSNCSFAYFNSVNDFIDYHATMLQNNYLTPGGAYYNGKTPSGVVVRYCPGCTSWPGNVTSIANSLFNKVASTI